MWLFFLSIFAWTGFLLSISGAELVGTENWFENKARMTVVEYWILYWIRRTEIKGKQSGKIKISISNTSKQSDFFLYYLVFRKSVLHNFCWFDFFFWYFDFSFRCACARVCVCALNFIQLILLFNLRKKRIYYEGNTQLTANEQTQTSVTSVFSYNFISEWTKWAACCYVSKSNIEHHSTVENA